MQTTVGCTTLSRVVRTHCELFKLLRVIGEGTAQTVVAVTLDLPEGARRVVSVTIDTAEETFHVFTDKVVKQGVLVIVVVFVDKECELATFTRTVPFMATVEIPGVRPGREVDIQFRDLRIENDLTKEGDVLTGKVVIVEFVKVSEFVQRFLTVCEGPAMPRLTTTPSPTTTIISSSTSRH